MCGRKLVFVGKLLDVFNLEMRRGNLSKNVFLFLLRVYFRVF